MRHAAGLSLALLFCGAVGATEPMVADTAPNPAAGPRSTRSTLAPDATAPPRKRLDLRVGKIQNLMTLRELDALMQSPDYERDAVVVEGKRELLPMKELEPVPAGFPPATLWWALKNPTQSWRIFLPDVNAKASGPPVDKVPAREFRWGP